MCSLALACNLKTAKNVIADILSLDKRLDLVAGFVTRIDLCEPVSQYENPFGTTLTAPGNNCKSKFKWSFLNKNSGRNLKLAWVAESPDGSYILAAGVRQKLWIIIIIIKIIIIIIIIIIMINNGDILKNC